MKVEWRESGRQDASAERDRDLHKLSSGHLLGYVVRVDRVPVVFGAGDPVPHADEPEQLPRDGYQPEIVHELRRLLLGRVGEVGRLRRLPRLVHDQRHQDARADARIAEQLQGRRRLAEPEHDVHDMPGAVPEELRRVGRLVRLPGVVRRRRNVLPRAAHHVVPRRDGRGERRVRRAAVPHD